MGVKDPANQEIRSNSMLYRERLAEGMGFEPTIGLDIL